MQGHVSSWLELTDSTQVRDVHAVVDAIMKLVTRDNDFEFLNLTANEKKGHITRYEAIYWDNHPPDYPKLLRRVSRRLWPGEWLLFEEKRSMTFCYDCSTLRSMLVSKNEVRVLNGEQLGRVMRRELASVGDLEVTVQEP